jgi:hypothetical protein
MGLSVVTVASGGLPIVETTRGTPVSEAANLRGVAVTKVVNKPGLPVVFVTATGGSPYVSMDPATANNVTVSGGGLVVINTAISTGDQGARVANSGAKTSGKYYFEGTLTVFAGTGSNNVGIGIGTTASGYQQMGNNATVGDMMFYFSGNLYSNGSNTGTSLGARAVGDVVGGAIDLDNRRVWWKKVSGTPGNWNNNVANNPATNVGGIVIPAGSMVPFCTFGPGVNVGDTITLNFGASAFTGAVPSGFTSGWPI